MNTWRKSLVAVAAAVHAPAIEEIVAVKELKNAIHAPNLLL
jgi:hypothetical protein